MARRRRHGEQAYLLVHIDPETLQVTDAEISPYPEVQGPWACLCSSRPASAYDLAKTNIWTDIKAQYPWVLPLLMGDSGDDNRKAQGVPD